MKKMVVTGAGANGFLGWHVRKAFSKYNDRINWDINFIGSEFDLTDQYQTQKMFDKYKPDVLVHMAAVCGGILANKNSPATFLQANTAMNINIYEAARKSNCKYVYSLGSICSYPMHCPVPFNEEDMWKGYPESTNAPYGLAKRHLYMMGKTYREQYGIKGVHLIPVNMMGENDHFNDLENSHVIPAFINKFINNKERVECWGTGTATREFVYAGDVARVIAKISINQMDIPEPINIGTGKDISIKDLAHLIAELTNFNGEIKFTGEVSDGQPKRRLDVSRAKEMLGFEAETSLKEGLTKTIEWYKENV